MSIHLKVEVRDTVREARKISPTKYYHIMMRGNNREKIFIYNEQKMYCMDILKSLVEEEPIEISAYCLMDNHVHLLVKGEITDLIRSIKRLNIRYAMKFNKKTDRIGHVFQDRYRSEVISDEPYLLHVIRYIHNNPVKAGMVKHPRDYRWSSYQEFFTRSAGIINAEQKKFIMVFFRDNFARFEEFHLELDYHEYLDIQEDIQYNRHQAAQRIITNYCHAKDISDEKQVLANGENLKELVKELLIGTKLSHRQIAKILGISNNIVHKVSLLET